MQRYSSISINVVLLFILCQITFANTAGIEQFIADVSPEEIKATIFDLQENVKLDQPDVAYKSRFALRVKNTSNPSDEAYDNIAEYIFRKFESYGMNVCGWHTKLDTADKLNIHFSNSSVGSSNSRGACSSKRGKRR